MGYRKIDGYVAELNAKHLPEDEYQRIVECTDRNLNQAFFSTIFDDGYFVYIYNTGDYDPLTKRDFPVLFSIIQDCKKERIKMLAFTKDAYENEDLKKYEWE